MSLRKCKRSGKEIPDTRHGSAQYYSFKEYYAAKKERSKKRYQELKVNYEEEKKNENLLAFFYSVILMKKPITFQDMLNHQFNFGFVAKETEYDGKIWKVIGSYAYHIEPKFKTVEIWQLNSKK